VAAEQEFPRGFAKAELRNKDRTIKKLKTVTSDVSSIMITSSERDDR